MEKKIRWWNTPWYYLIPTAFLNALMIFYGVFPSQVASVQSIAQSLLKTSASFLVFLLGMRIFMPTFLVLFVNFGIIIPSLIIVTTFLPPFWDWNILKVIGLLVGLFFFSVLAYLPTKQAVDSVLRFFEKCFNRPEKK